MNECVKCANEGNIYLGNLFTDEQGFYWCPKHIAIEYGYESEGDN